MLFVDDFQQSVSDLIGYMIHMLASSDCTDRINKRYLLELVLVWDYSDADFPTIGHFLIKLFNLFVLLGTFEVHVDICFEVCDLRDLLLVQVHFHITARAASQVIHTFGQKGHYVVVETGHFEFL